MNAGLKPSSKDAVKHVAPAKPWLKTPSKVVELLNLRDTINECDLVLVVCKHGEIMSLINKFDGEEAVVQWKGSVTVPRMVNNGETRLAHASVYPSRGEMYFTINPPSEGIFVAELAEIAQSKGPVEMKRFDKGYASPLESDRLFNGIVVDIENQAILCCDQSRKRSVGVWSVMDGRIHTEVMMTKTDDTGLFRPYTAAVHAVTIKGKRCQLLAVADLSNSTVQLFLMKKPRPGSQSFLEYEFLRTLASPGTLVGSVYQPQGVYFDPNGHLLVADGGNHRIQIFSADLPDDPVKGVLWDSFTTSTMGGFSEPVTVLSALEKKTSKPVILTGLHEDREVLLFK